MATSPRNELRIVSITEFVRNESGQWYWTTKAANGETVGDGSEGYHNLADAVSGFFAQQGVDLQSVEPDDNPYNKLVIVTDREYHIRKYAYGAPDPFNPAKPNALAGKGWQPPGVED